MAANNNLALRILFSAQDNASSVLDSLRNNAGKIAAAITGYFSVSFFKSAVDDAEKLDTQFRTLDGVIKATGSAAGLTADEIVDMSKRLDEATLGSAEGFRNAAAELLTFKSVGKDSFETTLMLAQDLAQSGFGTLEGNAVQLGKALEDPVNGLGALTRVGVTFTDAQKNMVKQFVETGETAKAQGVILDAVAGQVGGAGSAAGGGLSGAIDLVGKRLTDFKEQLGKGMMEPLTAGYNVVANFLGQLTKSGVVTEFGNAIGSAFSSVVTFATDAYNSVTAFYTSIKQDGTIASMQSAFSTAFSAIQSALGSLSDFVTAFYTSLKQDGTIASMQSTFSTAFSAIQSALGGLRDFFATFYTAIKQDGTIAEMQSAFVSAFSIVQSALGILRDFFTQFYTTISDSGALGRFADAWVAAIKIVMNIAARLTEPFIALFDTLTGGENNAKSFGEIFGTVLSKLADLVTVFVSSFATGLGVIEAAFFTVSGVAADFISVTLAGMAKIQEVAAAATFGELSASYKQGAAEMTAVSESFAASAEVNYKKAGDAVEGVSTSIEVTRAAALRLGSTSDETTKKVNATADALDTAGQSAGLTADQLDALGAGAQVADGKLVGVATAATHADNALKNGADTAAQLADAYKALGLTSSAELQQLATNAGSAFQTIKNSGTASALDVRNAFQAYADKAIAANGGVVSATLKADAAASQLSVTVDATGKVIVKSFATGGETAEELAAKIKSAAEESALLAEQEERAFQARRQQAIDFEIMEQQYAQNEADRNAARSAAFREEMKENGIKLAAAANAKNQNDWEELKSYGDKWINQLGVPGVSTGRNFQQLLDEARREAKNSGKKYAKGGIVRGQGTGTSDEIPAPWLSDGEYVMPADVTEEVGEPFLNAIRDGKKPVALVSGESSGGSSSGTIVVKFVSPTGQQVSGQFNKNDAEGILQIIKDAGMRTL